jgi:hypothetical protein
MPDSSYTAAATTLAELLNTAAPPMAVPDWQRSYSWGSDQVEVFWADINRFNTAYPDSNIDDQNYFLGSVVMVTAPNDFLLLDGQQRIATATILLAALREARRPLDSDASTRLQNKFIADWDDGTQQKQYSLTLNRYDKEFFRRAIQTESRPTSKATLRSHALIDKAYKFFEKIIDEAVADLSDQDALAWNVRVQNVLLNHVSLVVVKSNDEDNASSVFESLNDRGIGLSTPDLLRNLLLRKATDEQTRDSIVELWLTIFSFFEQGGVDQFLRHYWVSLRGDVKTRSLYRDIKLALESEGTDPLEFSTNLASAAADYRSLRDASDADDAIRRDLESINQLGATMLYPALLAGMSVRSADEDGYRNLVHALLLTFVRHTVILTREGTKLETAIFELAVALRNGETFEAAVAQLRVFSPLLSEVHAAFRTTSVPRAETAKYLLRQLEADSRGTDELILNNNKKVQLEHIYPQTPPSGSRLPNHAQVLNRIGNLTLLDHRLNASIKNADFATKRASAYGTSEINMTLDLVASQSPTWGLTEVSARQDALAQRAAKVWAFDGEEFNLLPDGDPEPPQDDDEIAPESLPEDAESIADDVGDSALDTTDPQ